MRRGALLVLGLLSLPAIAASPWRVELGAGIEHLDNGAPDWRELDLTVQHRFEASRSAELTLRQAERERRRDVELGLGFTLPLGDAADVSVRLTGAGDADFLPRLGGYAEFGWRLPSGWGLGAAVGRNLYDTADAPSTGTTLARAGVDRYVGDWRLAAGLTRARLDGGASSNAWRLQAERYIGETARVGLSLAGGRELESTPAGVLSTRVEAVAITGRLPLGSGWALNAALSQTRVSDREQTIDGVQVPVPGAYRRSGVRLGVQREF